MLEARHYYGNEKTPKPKGWSAIIIIDGVNRGCVDFKFKYEAEKHIKNNLEYLEKMYEKKASEVYVKKEGSI